MGFIVRFRVKNARKWVKGDENGLVNGYKGFLRLK
jgi:hypothetical protein